MLQIDSTFLRVILLIVSILGIIWFFMPMVAGIVNIGNAFGLFCSVILLIFSGFHARISAFLDKLYTYRAGKITLRICGIVILAGVLYCLILSILMLRSAYRKPKETPQAVIVLGCKVRGTRPSRMLSERIHAAYEAMQAYPDIVAVVSGGKGDDETISEAECMRSELTAMGIEESRIFIEDKSTSTSENLRFSKQILDEQGISGSLLIVTDAFHEMRAQYLAKEEGLPHCDAASASTSVFLLPTYWIREWFGLAHAFVFGN